LRGFFESHVKGQETAPKGYPKELAAIGDHIRKRRLDLKLTLEELAEKLQTRPGNIHNWEQHRRIPCVKHMPKIAGFLGYVPWDVYGKTLGEKIASHRKLLGLTQEQLAREIGVNPCTIISWEKGTRKPEKKRLKKLAAFFAQSGLPVWRR
jgi:transcriptional regulator with XRE-family HTH domain